MEEWKCVMCGNAGIYAARGLCSKCYPKVRVAHNLSAYVTKQDKWKQLIPIVTELYQSGLTTARVGTELGISSTTVRNILNKSGIECRRRGYSRIYRLNEGAFDSLDTEASAYWLGFIYADGFTGRNLLSVHLNVRDRQQVVALREFLESDVPIVEDGGNKVTVTVNSARLCMRLNALGVVVGRNRFELIQANLPLGVVRHFIRGYTDGDGSLTTSPKPRIKFTGQPDILLWIREQIYDYLGIAGTEPYRTKSDKVKDLTYSGRFQAPRIAHWLYDDATTYMDRKYEVLRSWDAYS